jgi:hypothetical protein
VTINTGGHLAPGNSIGKLTFSNILTLAGNYDWELGALKSDTTAPAATPGTDYDLIKLTASNVVATGSTLNLSFTGGAAGGPTGNSLWHSNQSWKIIDNQGAGTLTGLPTIASGTSSYPNKGSFGIAASGNDVVLSWTSAAAATIGLTATPVHPTIITSGTTTVNANVSNTAASGAWDLSYAYSTGDGLAGTGIGTKAVGAAADILALTFTGGAIGSSKGSVTVSDPFATNNSQTRNSLVTVLDHSNASLGASDTNALALDIGTFALNSGTQTSPFSIYNLVTTAGYTATLDLISIEGTDDTSTLTTNAASFVSGLEAGNHEDLVASLDTSVQGSFHAVYKLHMSDQDLPGKGTAVLQLNLSGTVLPEPATMTLLGLGGLAVGWSRIRGRKRRTA